MILVWTIVIVWLALQVPLGMFVGKMIALGESGPSLWGEEIRGLGPNQFANVRKRQTPAVQPKPSCQTLSDCTQSLANLSNRVNKPRIFSKAGG